MRSDLPSLNPGKAIAQAVHAGNKLVWNMRENENVKEWAGSEGYGTTITLSVPLRDIQGAFDQLQVLNIWALSGWMIDQTYPIVVPADGLGLIDQTKLSAPFRLTDENKAIVLYRKETTCAYIFGDKETLKPVLGEFDLYQ